MTYFSLGSGSWRGYPNSLHPYASVWARVHATGRGRGMETTDCTSELTRQSRRNWWHANFSRKLLTQSEKVHPQKRHTLLSGTNYLELVWGHFFCCGLSKEQRKTECASPYSFLVELVCLLACLFSVGCCRRMAATHATASRATSVSPTVPTPGRELGSTRMTFHAR